ncbi:MAG: AAA family ATPase, partial [Christensenellaceae bacterium]
MKIKQLILNNIGSYEGEHIFSFNIDDPRKNIILIGGRNGAGKTTFFDALRLCLYGYKMFGYRQNSQVYTSKVKRLINDKAKKKPTSTASIQMQILVEDGFSNSVFQIERRWNLEGAHFKEDYWIHKDGNLLNADECTDFDNYLLQTIPPALFNFHFFNGENVSEFLFDSTNGQSFRKAFMQICGLDTFDLLEEQLAYNIRAKNDGKSAAVQQKFEKEKAALSEATMACEKHCHQIDYVQNEMELLEEQIAQLDKAMTQYGGVANDELIKFQTELKAEENRRDEKRYFLKDAANNVLPYIILKKELEALKRQVMAEEQLCKNRLFREKLFAGDIKNSFEQKLKPFMKESMSTLPEAFFEALYGAMKEDCNESLLELLRLSEDEHMRLLVKIQECAAFDVQSIITAENEIDASLERAKGLRGSMDAKEAVDTQRFFSQKNNLLTQLEQQRQNLFDEKAALADAEKVKNERKVICDKACDEFKALLKEQSVTDMASRALLAFQELKKCLYSKYVALVEEKFSANFNRLISKTDLIDGIYISSLFEIVAYQQTELNVRDTYRHIETLGEEYVKTEIGERAFLLVQNSGRQVAT